MKEFILSEAAPQNAGPRAILSAPNSNGYWWWRAAEGKRWQLAQVRMRPFQARFFVRSWISGKPHGEWVKADVTGPNEPSKPNIDSSNAAYVQEEAWFKVLSEALGTTQLTQAVAKIEGMQKSSLTQS